MNAPQPVGNADVSVSGNRRPTTSVEIATLVEDAPTVLSFPEADAESHHIMCCVNDDVSLCAQDISRLDVVETDEPSGCRVCDYLDDTDFCPLGLVCDE